MKSNRLASTLRMVRPSEGYLKVNVSHNKDNEIDQAKLAKLSSLRFSIREGLESLYRAIVHTAAEIFGVQISALMLLSEDNCYLELVATVGLPEDISPGKIPRGQGISGQVVDSGKPFVTDDIAKYPSEQGLEVERHYQAAFASVPMMVGERVIGVLNVCDPEDGAVITGHDLSLLSILANQAAVAIGNARLYANLQRRVDNLAVINEVGCSLSAMLDPEMLLDTIVEASAQLLDCDYATIFLPDSQDGRFVPKMSYRYELEGAKDVRFAPGEGLVGYVIETGKALIVPDTSADPRFLPGPVKVGSMLMVPLSTRDKVIGVLTAERKEKGRFDTTDQLLLSTLADQAATAIENARLYKEVGQRAAQLEATSEVSRRIISILDLDELLSQVVELIQQILGYYYVHIFLVDFASNQAVFQAGAGEIGRLIAEQGGVRLKVGEQGIIGWVAAAGQPLLVNDVLKDPRYVSNKALPNTKSELAVPLKIGEQVIGILDVQSDELNAFGTEDTAILQTLGDQVAIAIENARLYKELARSAQELEQKVEERTEELAQALKELTAERDHVETLYRITRDLGISLDLDRVLVQALALINEAVGVEHGSIMLLDHESGNLIYRAALGRDKPLPRGGKMTDFRKGVGRAGCGRCNSPEFRQGGR